MEVIGKESPVVQGLGIHDTMGLEYNNIQVMEERAVNEDCHASFSFCNETVVSELGNSDGQTEAKSVQKKIRTPVVNTQGKLDHLALLLDMLITR